MTDRATLLATIQKLEVDIEKFHQILHGTATSTVTTDNGEVDTVAKRLSELSVFTPAQISAALLSYFQQNPDVLAAYYTKTEIDDSTENYTDTINLSDNDINISDSNKSLTVGNNFTISRKGTFSVTVSVSSTESTPIDNTVTIVRLSDNVTVMTFENLSSTPSTLTADISDSGEYRINYQSSVSASFTDTVPDLTVSFTVSNAMVQFKGILYDDLVALITATAPSTTGTYTQNEVDALLDTIRTSITANSTLIQANADAITSLQTMATTAGLDQTQVQALINASLTSYSTTTERDTAIQTAVDAITIPETVTGVSYSNGILTLTLSDASTLTTTLPVGTSSGGATIASATNHGENTNLIRTDDTILTLPIPPSVSSEVLENQVTSYADLSFTASVGVQGSTSMTRSITVSHRGVISFRTQQVSFGFSGFLPTVRLRLTSVATGAVLEEESLVLDAINNLSWNLPFSGEYSIILMLETEGASANISLNVQNIKVLYTGSLYHPINTLIDNKITEELNDFKTDNDFATSAELENSSNIITSNTGRVGALERTVGELDTYVTAERPILDRIRGSEVSTTTYEIASWFTGTTVKGGELTARVIGLAAEFGQIAFGEYLTSQGEISLLCYGNFGDGLILRQNNSRTELVKKVTVAQRDVTNTESISGSGNILSNRLLFGNVNSESNAGDTYTFINNLPAANASQEVTLAIDININGPIQTVRFHIPVGNKDNTGTARYEIVGGATTNITGVSGTGNSSGYGRNIVTDTNFDTQVEIRAIWTSNGLVIHVTNRSHNLAVDGGYIDVSGTWIRTTSIAQASREEVITSKVGNTKVSLINSGRTTWHIDFGGFQTFVDFSTDGVTTNFPVAITSNLPVIWKFVVTDMNLWVRNLTTPILLADLSERAETLRINALDEFAGQRTVINHNDYAINFNSRVRALDSKGNLFYINGDWRDYAKKRFTLRIYNGIAADIPEDTATNKYVTTANFLLWSWWNDNLDDLLGWTFYSKVNTSDDLTSVGLNNTNNGWIETIATPNSGPNISDVISQLGFSIDAKNKRTRVLSRSIPSATPFS